MKGKMHYGKKQAKHKSMSYGSAKSKNEMKMKPGPMMSAPNQSPGMKALKKGKMSY